MEETGVEVLSELVLSILLIKGEVGKVFRGRQNITFVHLWAGENRYTICIPLHSGMKEILENLKERIVHAEVESISVNNKPRYMLVSLRGHDDEFIYDDEFVKEEP
ncbi:MAG: hypothetical protein ACRCY4_08890 [Brevinema sp.]